MDLRRRLRAIAPAHDVTTVIACAFDHRTRMLPFIFADTRMAPAGVRAIGSAMADVVVTGEEFVLLSLLEVVLTFRTHNESMRSAFIRARDSGALDEIPGLVYSRGERDGVAEELIDTGIQRLLGELDELPDPVLGYRLLEPPSNSSKLASHALAANRIRRYSPS